MTRLLFVPALAVLLGFGACAPKSGESDPAARPDPLPSIVAALAAVGPTASVYQGIAIDNGNRAACAAWGSVAAAAPTLADVLTQVTSGEGLESFPAVSGSIAACGFDAPDVDLSKVEQYVPAAFATVQILLASYAPQLQASACRPYAVAVGAVEYASVLVPAAVAAVESLSVSVEPVGIDYSACEAD